MECVNSFKLYCVMCTNVKCTIVCSSSAKSLFLFSSTVVLSSLFFKTQKSHLHSDQTLPSNFSPTCSCSGRSLKAGTLPEAPDTEVQSLQQLFLSHKFHFVTRPVTTKNKLVLNHTTSLWSETIAPEAYFMLLPELLLQGLKLFDFFHLLQFLGQKRILLLQLSNLFKEHSQLLL